ncbi:rhodanese-like domain-containing protein [Halodesulfovibrio marinisediminis]|uniref:Thiosulfate/3-mercaptopyruvate sulfurtransferase n=1 Tax=Halodesulfovibrio marinisediminis DSM 17456 TaxID=1121457 RepID=A0A1N6I730_9BACT|nr:rhodanese-like domain-containing protein [Halodesulfovibrio marinisediminis]SIO27813.1 thiosulfate/3-mercaptopyruvate sulfurtransferase [Halodesulfovibrio marinisediminis DSM 17456]
MTFRTIVYTILALLFSTASFAATFAQLDTETVNALHKTQGTRLVDARNPNAFNGWAMQGEKHTGHLPAATNLAASWVTQELPRTAEVTAAKNLSDASSIIVYGYTVEQATTVANWLVEQGISTSKIALYKDSFAAWGNAGLPLERLPYYERIVPAQWVQEQLAEKKVLVVEASWGEGKVYKQNHIPTAVHLNTDLLESEDRRWNYLPVEEIRANLLSLGITADTPVVVYGEAGIDAARAAVAMQYVGVKDVRILNGGLHAWKEAKFKTERGVVTPQPATDFGTTEISTDLVIDMNEAKRILQDPNAELVSIRTWDEYIGNTTGYSYIKPKGRIKGAVWGHAGKDSYNMDDFRNPDNTMRDYHEIAAFWKEWGITPDKEVSFFCGTGWRASEALLYAQAMGFSKASLYDDGWHIWSMNPANPTASGTPER